MGLTAKKSDTDFVLVPAGMFLARCYRVIDLGTQETNYKGVPKQQHKVQVQWEVHGEDDKGEPLVTDKGEPMSISKRYTLSLSDRSQLYADLVSWRGKAFTVGELAGFDLKNILGKWCMLTVLHESSDDGSKTYANVKTISQVPKQMLQSLPEGFNTPTMYDIDNHDDEVFESLGQYTQQVIAKSPEYQNKFGAPAPQKGSARPNIHKDVRRPPGTPLDDDFESDIPFN